MNKLLTKSAALVMAAVLCICALAGCGGQGGNSNSGNQNSAPAAWTPVTVTDDLGRTVTIDEEPKSVIALIGSFADTWVLAGGTLKGAVNDAWEDFGLDLGSDVVNLGKYNAISLEQVFTCEPDLVIASANTKKQVELKDSLEKAGVKVLYFTVNSFEEYLNMLKICTGITGRADLYKENGEEIAKQVEAAKKAAAAKSDKAPKVLFIRTAASVVKAKNSKDTVLGLMLKDLGCINIADGSDLLEDLSIEKIIQEDPDMIFITEQGSDHEGAMQTLKNALTGNPAWSGLKAVKEDKVYYMEKRLYQLKPNKLWGQAYEELEKLIYEK